MQIVNLKKGAIVHKKGKCSLRRFEKPGDGHESPSK